MDPYSVLMIRSKESSTHYLFVQCAKEYSSNELVFLDIENFLKQEIDNKSIDSIFQQSE